MIIHSYNVIVEFGGDIVVGASVRDGEGFLTFRQLDKKMEIGKELESSVEDLEKLDVVFKLSDIRSIDVIIRQLNSLKEKLKIDDILNNRLNVIKEILTDGEED